jgi:uncharacterized protein YdgA (DUF945 family)
MAARLRGAVVKRVIWIVLAVVLAAALLAPVGFGIVAENRLRAILDELSRSGAIDYAVVKIDRGWFNSSSVVELELTGDIGRAYREYQIKAKRRQIKPLSITLRNEIHHGPFVFADAGRGAQAWLPSLATVNTQIIGYGTGVRPEQPVPVNIRTRLRLFGGGVTDISAPAWKGMVEAGRTQLVWKGAHARIRHTRGFGHVYVTASAPYFEGSDPGARVVLSGLQFEAHSRKGIEALSLGNFSFKLARLEMDSRADKAARRVMLDDLSIDGSSSAAADTINSKVQMQFGLLRVGDLRLGPGKYTMALRNLDAKALAKIDRAMADLKRQQLPVQQRNMMLGATVLSVLPQLLTRGPVLDIPEVRMQTQYGPVSGRGKLTVDTSDKAVLSNPLLLRKALVAEVEIKVPQKLLQAMAVRELKQDLQELQLKYSDEQIAKLARERVKRNLERSVLGKFVVLRDGVYTLSASLSGGQLTINGQPFQVPIGGTAH